MSLSWDDVTSGITSIGSAVGGALGGPIGAVTGAIGQHEIKGKLKADADNAHAEKNAQAGNLQDPLSYKHFMNHLSKQVGPLDSEMQKIRQQQTAGNKDPALTARLAQLQQQRSAINTKASSTIYDNVQKYGGAAMGLGDNQVALLAAAKSGQYGLSLDSSALSGNLGNNSTQTDAAAGNVLKDGADKSTADAKVASDQAAQVQATSDANAKAGGLVDSANASAGTAFSQAEEHAQSLVNTGLSTFDTALQGKQAEAGSVASNLGQDQGVGAGQAAGNMAQTNIAAKGDAARTNLSSDLNDQASTYVTGVASQNEKDLSAIQGLSTEQQTAALKQNSDTLVNEISQMEQSGQIKGQGEEQKLKLLLGQYSNENADVAAKQAFAKQIFQLVFQTAGTAAAAAV